MKAEIMTAKKVEAAVKKRIAQSGRGWSKEEGSSLLRIVRGVMYSTCFKNMSYSGGILL